jgi:amidophosphoribosyltransferase
MSDSIRHECGLAYIRLLQPLSYYQKKYGTAIYGLKKLYLLMEKQHNRGQDGAGIATVKLNMPVGYQTINRLRLSGQHAIGRLFENVMSEIGDLTKMYPEAQQHTDLLKGHLRFAGEVLLGHLRYGTQGKNNVEFCHPFIKSDIKPSHSLAMAGNFNLVNTDEIYDRLDSHPTGIMRESDLGAMIEAVHYYLNLANDTLPGITKIQHVLKQATLNFDGGYVFSGITGDGHSFLMRDANGIRPCSWYQDDEVIVAASERAAIMTTFNVPQDQIKTLEPGQALIVSADGQIGQVQILPPCKLTACSFERIYFSRGSDPDIYRERMLLGRNLAPQVLEAVNFKLKHTITSFIPNTAEIAFYGLIKGLEDYLKEVTLQKILDKKDSLTADELRELLWRRIRIEKTAIKDAKLRTFITEDSSRNEMVQHVYDITYGTVEANVDTLVILDDSIVRGTTLRESIIRMLSRLSPKKIIVVSSAPQIRYPDCYGIDMSRMGDFIAFQAAVALLADIGQADMLQQVYDQCKAAAAAGKLMETNFVKQIYAPFSPTDISKKIAELIKHEEVNIELEVIFQSIDGLNNACPNHTGDWYFTGDYPTLGGNRVANRAFMNYMEHKEKRGY